MFAVWTSTLSWIPMMGLVLLLSLIHIYDACIAAVKLSERYISDRFLPDKAIDLMDEAAAKLRMEMCIRDSSDEVPSHDSTHNRQNRRKRYFPTKRLR